MGPMLEPLVATGDEEAIEVEYLMDSLDFFF